MAGIILQLDEQQRYLTVSKSSFGLYVDPDRERMVFHYDYDREPLTAYPPAHVQVSGQADDLADLAARRGQPGKQLAHFHFPLGGRRFRPILEDVIEFLVVEDLADARPDWQDVIQEAREEWEAKQLRAAVRRNPDAAIEQLREDQLIP